MKPYRRRASGGYMLFNAAVVLLLVVSLLFMASSFTGFTLFPAEVPATGEIQVMKNYTASGSPHELPLELEGLVKSVRVSGRMRGNGSVKIVLAAGGRERTVLEMDSSKVLPAAPPITGLVTGEGEIPGEQEETLEEEIPQEEPTPEGMLPEEVSPETPEEEPELTATDESAGEDTTPQETETVKEANATVPEESAAGPEEETGPAEEPEVNATLPEENATKPEENATIPSGVNETEENVTAPEEAELPENMTIEGPEANVTIPEENVTLPEENMTEEVIEPELNETLIEENLTEEVIIPSLALSFEDECRDTCVMHPVEDAVLIIYVEGEAELELFSVGYELQVEREKVVLTQTDDIILLFEQLNLTENFMLSDVDSMRSVTLQKTVDGYVMEIVTRNGAITLDSSDIGKMKPGLIRNFDEKNTTRILIKTNELAEFFSVGERPERTSKIKNVREVDSGEFSDMFDVQDAGYARGGTFLDTKAGRPLLVDRAVEDYVSVDVTSDELEALIGSSFAYAIEPDNHLVTAAYESMNITMTDVAHSMGYSGIGKSICVIDTGLNASAAGLMDGVDVFGYNFVDDSGDYSDGHGHGTMMTYIITRFAPGATIYAAKALDDSGMGYSSDIAAALDWCAENGADVVGMSIGEGAYLGYCDDEIVAGKVNSLSAAGIAVVASNGNSGYSAAVTNPACASSAIRIAATDKRDSFWIYSNFNNATLLAAVGVGIFTVNNRGGGESISGTSASAAMVAGIAALVLENATLDTNATKYLLVHTGDVISHEGRQLARVNAYNALTGNHTNALAEGTVSTGKLDSWYFGPQTLGNLCTNGNDCSSGETCVGGYCRSGCDYYSGQTPTSVSGRGCSPFGIGTAWTSYGTCYDSTATGTGGTYGCSNGYYVRMDCGTTCNLGTDNSWSSCTTTSGDACDTYGGNFAQEGLCAQYGAYNCVTSGAVSKIGSTYYQGCSSGGECTTDITTGDYERTGYCANSNCCESVLDSGEPSGAPVFWDEGDESCTCYDNYICDSTPASGPTADGVCVNGGACDTDLVACSVGDAWCWYGGGTPYSSCATGRYCDSVVGDGTYPGYYRDGRCGGTTCCTDALEYESDGTCGCEYADMSSAPQCDNSPSSSSGGYDGVCAYDGSGSADSDVTCDTDAVYYDDEGGVYYNNYNSYAAGYTYTGNTVGDVCDSDATGGFSRTGMWVNTGCDTIGGVVRADYTSDFFTADCDSSGSMCDSATASGTNDPWAQDGLCASGASGNCNTAGFVCLNGGTYYADESAGESCSTGDQCDETLTDGYFSAGSKRYDPQDGYCDNCASYVGEDADCEQACGASSNCDELDPGGWWCSSNVVTGECQGTNNCVYSSSGGDVGTCEYTDSYDSNCGGSSQCDELSPSGWWCSSNVVTAECSSACAYSASGGDVGTCEYTDSYDSNCGGSSACDEQSPSTDLNTCNQVGYTYYEDRCGSTCVVADRTDTYECGDSGCSCGDSVCDGVAPNAAIDYCNRAGTTYYRDMCSGSGDTTSDYNSLCEDDYTGCTANSNCDGLTTGTDLNRCDLTGAAYYEDECSSICGLQDITTVCDTTETGCTGSASADGKSPSACDGTSGYVTGTCTYETYEDSQNGCNCGGGDLGIDTCSNGEVWCWMSAALGGDECCASGENQCASTSTGTYEACVSGTYRTARDSYEDVCTCGLNANTNADNCDSNGEADCWDGTGCCYDSTDDWCDGTNACHDGAWYNDPESDSAACNCANSDPWNDATCTNGDSGCWENTASSMNCCDGSDTECDGTTGACVSGTYRTDPDSYTYLCETCYGDDFLPDGTGTNSDCCGDDGSSDDFEQTSGAGRSACINGAEVADGSTSGAFLVSNGQIYSCNSAGTFGFDDDYSTCQGPVEGLYCTSGSTWASGLENGCTCAVGTDCTSGLCVNGYCRASCNGYSGRGCSEDGTSYSTYGTCYDEDGVYDCDTIDPIRMACDSGGCDLEADASYDACTTNSGDSCMSSVGGDFSQDGTCASGATNNCDTGGELCFDSEESTYYSTCTGGCEYSAGTDTDTCDSAAASGGDYSANGMCTANGCDTNGDVCTDSQASGTLYNDCSNANCEDGNACMSGGATTFTRNGRCAADGNCCTADYDNDGADSCGCDDAGDYDSTPVTCDPDPSEGSTMEGLCVQDGTTCDDGEVAMDGSSNLRNDCSTVDSTPNSVYACMNDTINDGSGWSAGGVCVSGGACDEDDVAYGSDTVYYSCGSSVDGQRCDTVTNGGSWTQDSMCVREGGSGSTYSCDTSGHACYDSVESLYEEDCSYCPDLSDADNTITGGGDFSKTGICCGGSYVGDSNSDCCDDSDCGGTEELCNASYQCESSCNYPGSGTWTVSGHEICAHRTITLSGGGITVNNGGHLEFNNVTLYVPTGNDITISSGGNFTAYNHSTIEEDGADESFDIDNYGTANFTDTMLATTQGGPYSVSLYMFDGSLTYLNDETVSNGYSYIYGPGARVYLNNQSSLNVCSIMSESGTHVQMDGFTENTWEYNTMTSSSSNLIINFSDSRIIAAYIYGLDNGNVTVKDSELTNAYIYNYDDSIHNFTNSDVGNFYYFSYEPVEISDLPDPIPSGSSRTITTPGNHRLVIDQPTNNPLFYLMAHNMTNVTDSVIYHFQSTSNDADTYWKNSDVSYRSIFGLVCNNVLENTSLSASQYNQISEGPTLNFTQPADNNYVDEVWFSGSGTRTIGGYVNFTSYYGSDTWTSGEYVNRYFPVNVTDSNGAPVSGINVSIRNETGDLMTYGDSGSDGMVILNITDDDNTTVYDIYANDGWELNMTMLYPTAPYGIGITIYSAYVSDTQLLPASPTTADDLEAYVTCTDPEYETLTAYWSVYKDDVIQAGQEGFYSVSRGISTNVKTISSSLTAKGQEWKVEFWCDNSVMNGSKVNTTARNIQNTPPSITSASITNPEPVLENEDLVCTAAGWTDADADSEYYWFEWIRNGATNYTELVTGTNTHTLGEGNTSGGGTWQCNVTPYDGEENGTSQISGSVTVDWPCNYPGTGSVWNVAGNETCRDQTITLDTNDGDTTFYRSVIIENGEHLLLDNVTLYLDQSEYRSNPYIYAGGTLTMIDSLIDSVQNNRQYLYNYGFNNFTNTNLSDAAGDNDIYHRMITNGYAYYDNVRSEYITSLESNTYLLANDSSFDLVYAYVTGGGTVDLNDFREDVWMSNNIYSTNTNFALNLSNCFITWLYFYNNGGTVTVDNSSIYQLYHYTYDSDDTTVTDSEIYYLVYNHREGGPVTIQDYVPPMYGVTETISTGTNDLDMTNVNITGLISLFSYRDTHIDNVSMYIYYGYSGHTGTVVDSYVSYYTLNRAGSYMEFRNTDLSGVSNYNRIYSNSIWNFTQPADTNGMKDFYPNDAGTATIHGYVNFNSQENEASYFSDDGHYINRYFPINVTNSDGLPVSGMNISITQDGDMMNYGDSGSDGMVILNITDDDNTTVYEVYEEGVWKVNMTMLYPTAPYGVGISSSAPSGASGLRWDIDDASGSAVFTVDEDGDMFIGGALYESQVGLSPPAGSFIIQNVTGDTVAYVTGTGDLYLQGTATMMDVTGLAGYNLEVRNVSDSVVVWFDDDGNLKLQGYLVQDYAG